MRRLLAVLLLGCMVVGGCGIWMNSDYSQRLDETVAWAKDMNRRAEEGTLQPEEMKDALRTNAALWDLFKQARDGVKPEETP